MSPKKPNSAVRHVAKVDLNNSLRLTARLPGRGYLCSKYNRVLIEGGRANDLPGVGYTAIRGAFDSLKRKINALVEDLTDADAAAHKAEVKAKEWAAEVC